MSAALNGTILIVEDDKKTATLVALYLEREGFKTLTAYNGQSALDLARDRKPIFIILVFIFERFYRSEKSRPRAYGGSGIGLAIIKEMINAHDGQVGAEIIDGETHVWFTLPL